MKILWTEDFGNGQEPAPALLATDKPQEEETLCVDAMEEILDEPKHSPKETVKGFGLGK